MGGTLNISQVGLDLIKHYEALRLKPYLDANGNVTCGYGHKYTSTDHYPAVWTTDLADMVLTLDVSTAVHGIRRFTYVQLSQPQMDALTSLVFNIGTGDYFTSTLRKCLNRSDYHGAADQFLVWDKIRGEFNSWQAQRRKSEHDLFLTGTK